MIPTSPPAGLPYNRAEYDDLWHIASDAGMPLSLHTGTGALPQHERGPGGAVINYAKVGLLSADSMILFRSAVKQICRRQGYHASFMCRPKVANTLSSGWHLHQSLIDRRSNANAFASQDKELLSRTGRNFLAGLLSHARGAAAFSTPSWAFSAVSVKAAQPSVSPGSGASKRTARAP